VTYLLEELGGLANAATFIVFGAVIVGPVLAGMTWRAAVYGLLSLTLVRMLPVALSLVGTQARWPSVAFLGWFGPRGLASIVFTIIVVDEANLPNIASNHRGRRVHDRRLGLPPRCNGSTVRSPLCLLVSGASAE